MTNKPMLSVDRELLERAASAIEKHHGSIQWVIASDLRAIIDKPVNFLTPDCPDCACVQDGQCLCIPSKPAAQHQGEPVAYQIRRRTDREDSAWTKWQECSEMERAMHSHEVGKYNRFGIMREIRALYAEHHAPVATIARLMEAVHAIPGFPGFTGTQLRQLAEYLNGMKP